jgi:hypothetical protein
VPGYTKLFSSILDSTIWRESNATRILWITMLAKANRDGLVEAALSCLADLARISVPKCQEALSKLMAPDPYSRTKANEGRRIAECDGGWLILNHAKYRELMNAEERRIYKTEKQRHYRTRASGQRWTMWTHSRGRSRDRGRGSTRTD